jgi:hypothetical protein
VRAEGWAEAERPKPRESREIFGERRPILGHAPSDDLIVRLTRVLGADLDELLLLAEKIPESIRKRVLQRADVFRRVADNGRRGPRPVSWPRSTSEGHARAADLGWLAG